MIHLGHALLAIISVFNPHPRPKPYWLNGVPNCPAGWSVYAVESRAIAGKDSVICVREPKTHNSSDPYASDRSCDRE